MVTRLESKIVKTIRKAGDDNDDFNLALQLDALCTTCACTMYYVLNVATWTGTAASGVESVFV